MNRRMTVMVLAITILVLGVDSYLGLGLTAALSDFLVIFLVVALLLGVLYSTGD